jgi:hypothetical protein
MIKVFMLLAELPLDPKGSSSSNSYRIRQPRARCLSEQSGFVDLEGQHIEKVLPGGDSLVSPGAKHIPPTG